MANGIERREARRFTMALPLSLRCSGPGGTEEKAGKTRDVSFRGLYFWSDASLETGSEFDFTLTLPKEVTRATDVHIRCHGRVVRVEARNSEHGIAARIENYEFLPAA